METENEKKLILFLWNDTGTIWNSGDWLKARTLRIIGSFIGSLANVPWQVKEHGLPLLLSKNETRFLLDMGFAELRKCPTFLEEPSVACRTSSASLLSEMFLKQANLLKAERAAEIEERASVIVKGKLAKRRKMNPDTEVDDEEEKKKIIEEELANIPDPSRTHLFVQMPTEDPWVSADDFEKTSWSYPNNEMERIEYAAFRYLWEAGYTVTGGGKFGASLAAYQGDPVQCHAQLLILCVTRERKLSSGFVVAFARLAHTVKKTAVLAYFNAASEVVFQSVEWVTE